MADEPYVDPAHRLPDEEFGAVMRRAAVIRGEYLAEQPEPEPPADLLELAAREPDPSLFPDAPAPRGYPGYSMLDEHHGEDS